MSSARNTCRLIVLGSTGSVGTQTLEVVEHLNALHASGASLVRYEIVGLAAGRDSEDLRQQSERFGVRHVAVGDSEQPAPKMAAGDCNVRYGQDAAERLVNDLECDVVVAAISGAAGLPATLAAVRLGRDIALANKETLVAAGELIIAAAHRSGARLLPVDSEHSALWQCLAGAGVGTAEGDCQREGVHCAPPLAAPPSVHRIILTASGGPFRLWSKEQIENATPEQALRHPTWNMGPKVTVDCASLTNKGLEIVEAHWLFGLSGERIEVVIHPQSIVHSLVEYADGSTIAQLGSPDMRAPIQYALTFPRRASGLSQRLDWRALRSLEFEPPDLDRFPALSLAHRAIREGGTAGAVFNAANEAAVGAFLAGRLHFGEVPRLAAAAMDHITVRPLSSLDDCLAADAAARAYIQQTLGD